MRRDERQQSRRRSETMALPRNLLARADLRHADDC
jgi:hypothetical protein